MLACHLIRLVLPPLVLILSLTGCALNHVIEERDEVIAGLTIPIPRGMTRVLNLGIGLTVPGFAGEKVTYRGETSPHEIVTFYQNEMPARSWKPNASLVTQGGILAYTKDNRSVLITVDNNDSGASLTIVVGSMGP